ncbi:hypothetical protein NDU88_002623 [Pleurodeles waltl]|uniref:Uncharacterized protein n=1 Tax=Pleurodeles waltl TaxID=8319 RepID=A0AAV7TL72_PLEWA|nr:hypothetical protein NDU88_002623 [Pleurodeles waltl]
MWRVAVGPRAAAELSAGSPMRCEAESGRACGNPRATGSSERRAWTCSAARVRRCEAQPWTLACGGPPGD